MDNSTSKRAIKISTFLQIPTNAKKKDNPLQVSFTKHQLAIYDAFQQGQDAEKQINEEIDRFTEEYKKTQTIKNKVLRLQTQNRIKNEQDELLKKMDFGLKQKFI